MSDSLPSPGWRSRFKCHERDVLQAFSALRESVRLNLERAEKEKLTLGRAVDIASSLCEQRDLVRQILARRAYGKDKPLPRTKGICPTRFKTVADKEGFRAKHLLFLNERLRGQFLALAEEAGLDIRLLQLLCEKHAGALRQD